MKNSNSDLIFKSVSCLPKGTVFNLSEWVKNTSDNVQFSRIKKVWDDSRKVNF